MLAIGDDRNIYVYSYSTAASAGHSFGSKHTANKENWVRKFLLQGHTMDIVDISWSPSIHANSNHSGYGDGDGDHLLLASGSIDNTVMLWDVPYELPSVTASKTANANAAYCTTNVVSPGQVLKGHTSFVKGVAFDPVGRYLLSVSSDNVLILWENSKHGSSSSASSDDDGARSGAAAGPGAAAKASGALSSSTLSFLSGMNIAPRSGPGGNTAPSLGLGLGLGFGGSASSSGGAAGVEVGVDSSSRWVECTRLDEPFRDSADKTLSRRCDWAPDGSCICLSNCVKSSKPIGNVIKRLQWDSVCDLVGHDASITCARFYQELLCSDSSGSSNGNGNDAPPVSVVALGDQFGVLSVWNTNSQRALMICRDLFSSTAVGSNGTLGGTHSCGITDLSWRRREDGGEPTYVLSVASMDGTVAVVEFSAAELGKECAPDSLNRHYARVYGISRTELLRSGRDCNALHKQFLKDASSRPGGAAAQGFGGAPSVPVAQHVNVLTARSKTGYKRPLTTTKPLLSTNGTAAAATVTGNGSAQVVGRTSSGKTRITPVLMNANGAAAVPSSNKYPRLGNGSGTSSASSSSVQRFMSTSQVGFGQNGGPINTGAAGAGAGAGAGATVAAVAPLESVHSRLAQRSVLTLNVPADASAGIKCHIPYRQAATADFDSDFDSEKDKRKGCGMLTIVLESDESPAGIAATRTSKALAAEGGGLRGLLSGNGLGSANTAVAAVELSVAYMTVPGNSGKDAQFSTLCCRKVSCTSSTTTTSAAAVPSMCWSTAILGHVTALAGFRHHTSNELVRNLVVLGTTEGTLLLLSAVTGLRVYMPLVVGSAVAHVCLMKGSGGGFDLLAVTVLGGIIVFRLEGACGEQLVVRQTVRTSLHPLLLSIHSSCAATHTSSKASSTRAAGLNPRSTSTTSTSTSTSTCADSYKPTDTEISLLQCTFDREGGCHETTLEPQIVVHLSYLTSRPLVDTCLDANANADVGSTLGGRISNPNPNTHPSYVTYTYQTKAGFWGKSDSTRDAEVYQLSRFNCSRASRGHGHPLTLTAGSVSNIAILANSTDDSTSAETSASASTSELELEPVSMSDLIRPVTAALAMRPRVCNAAAMQGGVQLAGLCQVEDSIAQCVSKLARLPAKAKDRDPNSGSAPSSGNVSAMVLATTAASITDSIEIVRSSVMKQYKHWCKTWIQICCQVSFICFFTLYYDRCSL